MINKICIHKIGITMYILPYFRLDALIGVDIVLILVNMSFLLREREVLGKKKPQFFAISLIMDGIKNHFPYLY